MVNKHIRVYARIKKESGGQNYEVISDENENYDIIRIFQGGPSYKRKRRTFRFNQVFEQDSMQDEIFSVICKPIIKDVFAGINATIFAYGATGSGKTYTLTGSQTNYDERGLIPRTLEYLFRVTNDMSNYMFFISYLEIYNEIAYDLLHPKQNFTCLEELPRVIVLEDDKGEAHFKNLCLKEVNSEKEAMSLLYSGDNNRSIAETPLNDYSSRSHCVFTVHVISKNAVTGSITKSKLNLVDLAGSERLHRMNLIGITLNEARHINLSLHHLERVIQALSQKGTTHVPYRNSLMTFILRDSLGGNCLTAMLATLSMLRGNLDESISTCKFAQRVCLITLNANVNYVDAPNEEIYYLRNELRRLKRQLNGKKINANKKLTKEEEIECKFALKQYLLGKEEFVMFNDVRKVKYYFELMRDQFVKAANLFERESAKSSATAHSSEKTETNVMLKKIEKKYKEMTEDKDEKLCNLMKYYDEHISLKPSVVQITNEHLEDNSKMNTLDKKEFNIFFSQSLYKPHFDACSQHIKTKYREAVRHAEILSAKQKDICNLKKAVIASDLDADIIMKLTASQNSYREQLQEMHTIKIEIDHLKAHMNKLKGKIMDDYKVWCFSGQNLSDIFNCASHRLGQNAKNTKCACGYHRSSPREDQSHRTDKTYVVCHNPTPRNLGESPHHTQRPYNRTEAANESSGNYNSGLMKIPAMHSISTESLILRKGNGVTLGRSQNFLNIPSQHSSVTTQKTDILQKHKDRAKRSTSFLRYPCSSVKHGEILAYRENEDRNVSPILKVKDNGKYPKFFASPVRSSSPPKFIKCDAANYSKRGVQLSLVQCKSTECISQKPEELEVSKDSSSKKTYYCKFVKGDDHPEFVTYLETIPLTGDEEVDEEIIKFYRSKYRRNEIKLFTYKSIK